VDVGPACATEKRDACGHGLTRSSSLTLRPGWVIHGIEARGRVTVCADVVGDAIHGRRRLGRLGDGQPVRCRLQAWLEPSTQYTRMVVADLPRPRRHDLAGWPWCGQST